MRTAATAGGLLLIGAATVAAHRAGALEGLAGGAGDWVSSAAGAVADWVGVTDLDMNNANLQAFLRMIRYAEGTASANGYRMLFGGKLFEGYADHPRIPVTATLGGQRITSTAAGAYQFLARTWDDIKRTAGVSDFSPASQDRAAAALIRRRGALADVYAGRFEEAVRKCAREWASLPGSPYGQPVKTMGQVKTAYQGAGGWVA